MNSNIFMVMLLLLMFINESVQSKTCRLEKKAKGYTFVCDSSRVPRSKVTRETTNTVSKEKSKRRKFRLKVKCEELQTEWIDKANLLISLTKLFNITCPDHKFLQEMKLSEDEKNVQMKYKCCMLK